MMKIPDTTISSSLTSFNRFNYVRVDSLHVITGRPNVVYTVDGIQLQGSDEVLNGARDHVQVDTRIDMNAKI